MDETTILTSIILRMLERIIAVLIGGVSIYLGYRLFLNIPVNTNQKGELELPGIKLTLSKVGPGVFFSAFGSIVVAYSLLTPISSGVQQRVSLSPEVKTSDATNLETISFTGMGQAPAATIQPAPVTPRVRNRVLGNLQMLNCLNRLGKEDYPELYTQAEPALREAKKQLLLSVWDEELWGKAEQLEMGMLSIKNDTLLSIYNEAYRGCPR